MWQKVHQFSSLFDINKLQDIFEDHVDDDNNEDDGNDIEVDCTK